MAQGEVFLSEPAPSGGAVVFLSTNSPFASVPAKVKIGTRGTSATFNIKTRQVASQTAVTISATYGVTVSAVLTITPRTTALSSVTVNPTTVVGGNTAQGTATLSGAAPTGGLIVTLASANPSVVGVPPSVTVTAGSSSANFNVTTSQVGSSTSTSISGTYGGTASTSITVVPAAAGLSSVRVDPTTVVGGNTALGTVNLTGAAPTGGLTVSLASDNPSVAGVPASATVPAGSASTNFNVTTTTVLFETTAMISGSYGGGTSGSSLTVDPPSSGGTNYYVSKNGDNGDGRSLLHAKTTISAGCALLSSGDTLLIDNGTYAEFIAAGQIPSGNDSAHRTTVKAINRRGVILQPSTGQNPYRVIYFQDAHHIEIQGLVLDSTNAQLEGVKITHSTAPASSDDILLNDLEVKNSRTMGVLISGDAATNCEVRNSLIWKNGNDSAGSGLYHQIYISSPYITVDGCELAGDTDNTTGHGIHVYGNAIMSHQRIYNNVIHDVGTGIGIYGGDDQLVYNNVLYHNMLGIRVRSYEVIGTASLYNNTVEDSFTTPNGGGIGILAEVTQAFAVLNVRNNIVSNSSTAAQSYPNGLAGTRDHQLVSNSPGYVDPANHDYHMTSGSAARDAGIDLSSMFTTDKDGVFRPQGGVFDIGAYER